MTSAKPGVGSGLYLLDTSILVLSLRGDAVIRARIATLTKFYIASPALGELYDGAYGSPTRATAAVADIATLALTNIVLGTDAETAEIYGRTRSDLKRRGRIMPDNDLWIAATALQYDVTLAARDVHFNWITGLRIEQW